MISFRKLFPRLFDRLFGRLGRNFYSELSEDQMHYHAVMTLGFRTRLFGWPGVDIPLSAENVEAMMSYAKKRLARDRIVDFFHLLFTGEHSDFCLYLAKEILEKDVRFVGKTSANGALGDGIDWDVYRDRHGVEVLVPALGNVSPFTGRFSP